MMSQSSHSRTGFELSEAVDHKLNLYALAAGAAGVGLLALAPPAEAKIVYTKTHRVIGLNHLYKLDLNHDGIADFLIQETQTGSTGFKVNRMAAKSRMANAVAGYANQSRGYALALKRGTPIGGRRNFVSRGRFGEEMAEVQQSDSVFYKYYGPWTNVANRYLGLKFKIHGTTHYGWARLTVVDRGFKLTGTLTGYAYETIPNKAIFAGSTKATEETKSLTLGHLAGGASAVSHWRVKQTVATHSLDKSSLFR
jgi:hypothetical protein